MAKIPAVTEYTISETLFGSHVVTYQCPHCNSQLKSKETEIGQATQCPECGKGFGVTKKAAREIQQAKTTKAEEKRRKDEEREATKPRCVICGKKQSLLVHLSRRDGDVGLYCDLHLAERERDEKIFKAKQRRNTQPPERDVVTKPPKRVGTPDFDRPSCDIADVYTFLGVLGIIGGCLGLFGSMSEGSGSGIGISFSIIGMSIASFAVSSLLRDVRSTAHFSKMSAQYLSKIAAKE